MTLFVPVDQQSEEDKRWMEEALVMADEAFQAAEVPVGSVFVRNGKVIAKHRNRTNELMNVGAVIDRASSLKAPLLMGSGFLLFSLQATRHAELEAIDHILSMFPPKSADFPINPHGCPEGDNPFKSTTLYVTIEPCIMCASALRQVGIQRVVFGAGNERFGGNGSVLPINNE